MYILLYQGTKIIPSRLIQWYSRSDYSHVAWCLDDGTTFESSSIAGVRQMKHPLVGYDLKTKIDFFTITDCSIQEQKWITEFFISQLGKKYDYPGVISFLTKTERPRRDDRWFCSEIMLTAALYANVNILHPDVDPFMVNPRDISLSPRLERVECPKWFRELQKTSPPSK